MKKVNHLILLFFLFALSFGLNAQVNGSVEDELIEALETVPSLDGNLSRVTLDQASSNVVEIEQYNRQLADVQQSGSYNEVHLIMDGDLNGAVIRQDGHRNQADIYQIGRAHV